MDEQTDKLSYRAYVQLSKKRKEGEYSVIQDIKMKKILQKKVYMCLSKQNDHINYMLVAQWYRVLTPK